MPQLPALPSTTRRLQRFALLAFMLGAPGTADLVAARFTLRWVDNSTNETGFTVERATGTTGAFAVIANTTANTTSHVDENLLSSTVYRYRISAYNQAGRSAYSNTATGTTPAPAPANTAPTISSIATQNLVVNSTSAAIPFTIGDAQTAATSLTLIRNASNTALIPVNNITLGGSGTSRTVTIRPASNASGWSTIWIKVSDGSLTKTISFVVNVQKPAAPLPAPTNTAPTVSSIAAQNLAVNATAVPIPFTIGDAQTPSGSLTLIKNSSNQTLIPLSNITFGGSGASRTVTVRPVTNTTGWSTIWIQVSDGSLTKTISFTVNVSLGLAYGDIGSPRISGSQTITGSSITIRAGGTVIGDTSDQFHFGRVALVGDAELTVRVKSLTYSHEWAKAGLMFRSSTAANAAYVFACVTPGRGLALEYRQASGAVAVQQLSESGTAPKWLKLSRSGDTFYAFHSGDGVTWSLLDFVKVQMPATTPAGLAVMSRSDSVATTAVFENLGVD